MQRDAIAFAIENDGAKAVVTDLVFRVHYFAAMGFSLRDRVIEPAGAIEINERAGGAGMIFRSLGQI